MEAVPRVAVQPAVPMPSRRPQSLPCERQGRTSQAALAWNDLSSAAERSSGAAGTWLELPVGEISPLSRTEAAVYMELRIHMSSLSHNQDTPPYRCIFRIK